MYVSRVYVDKVRVQRRLRTDDVTSGASAFSSFFGPSFSESAAIEVVHTALRSGIVCREYRPIELDSLSVHVLN